MIRVARVWMGVEAGPCEGHVSTPAHPTEADCDHNQVRCLWGSRGAERRSSEGRRPQAHTPAGARGKTCET
jgi:hypothetical protein